MTAATGNAARIIGVSERLGFIKEGYLADIVIVNGDPLESLSALERPAHVIKDGEVIF